MFRYRARLRLLNTLAGGSTARYTQIVVALAVFRRVRAMFRSEPETIYVGKLGKSGRIDVATSKPLPRRLRNKRVWRAFVADAEAEAAGR